ncbi:MAG: protein CpxP [Bacteroidia bacterium]|jgi:protein CpxP
MKFNKFLRIAVVVLFISNLILLGFMLNHRLGMKKNRSGPKHEIIEALDLTPDQTEKYEALITNHISQLKASELTMREHKKSLYQRLNTNAMDEEVDSLAALIGEEQKRMELVHFRHFESIKELCTPEQLPKFDELRERLERLFDKRGPGGRKP